MKVLIIDEMHKSIITLLEEINLKADYRPLIKREEILEIIDGYEGIFIRSKTSMDRELLEKGKNLKFIARAGAGLEKIDQDYVKSRNIELFHAAKGNRDAVAEQAIGGLLALFNHLLKADREVRKGVWDREGNRGIELKGKTVGIFGYGNMGKAFAKRLKGFDVEVLAYDKYKSGFGDRDVKEVSMEELQEKAEILSIHVPLTDETRMFFDDKVISGFKKPIWLINTARGEVISFSSINRALDKGQILGAILDVLENEKFDQFTPAQKEEFDRLASRENVLFTPHVAGWTFESYEKINEVLVKQIRKKFGL
ncbi:NAD(P)-dependent oxidoreductase [Algoriphagus sediminis]|uniref:NAD(P)-dependent oxidoreductase n=1 Tax=Algoriphagus sediminis TaxID=3057113 RepID=A0ABT7YAI3_9BACT|nr:NAD(P)-dependent oxidoreductase [Algoriphagus sediminis]MDN3203513.1 NAD(P)-dependent oxidoreductase [Algoriphagus sediminis]